MKVDEIFNEFKSEFIDQKKSEFIDYVQITLGKIWAQDFDIVKTQLFKFGLRGTQKKLREISQTIKTSIVACYGLTVTESGN